MGVLFRIVGRFLLTTLAGYGAGKTIEAITQPDYVEAQKQAADSDSGSSVYTPKSEPPIIIKAAKAVGIPVWVIGLFLVAIAAYIYKTFFK